MDSNRRGVIIDFPVTVILMSQNTTCSVAIEAVVSEQIDLFALLDLFQVGQNV